MDRPSGGQFCKLQDFYHLRGKESLQDNSESQKESASSAE